MTQRDAVAIAGFARPSNTWHAMRTGTDGWATSLCNQYTCAAGQLTALAAVTVRRAHGVSPVVGFCSTCRRTYEWRAAQMDDRIERAVAAA